MTEYLQKAISDYVKKENVEGAFYIDGQWGSGKTYFIKEFQKQFNLNHACENGIDSCLYISLSGMKDITDISSELFALCHPTISKIGNSKICKSLFTLLKAAGNLVGIESNNVEDFKNNISSFLENDFSILVLDDFERCRIDLQELFAFIVSLINENKIKIILIGNDEEVRRYLQENYLYKEKQIASNISKNYEEYCGNLEKVKEPLIYDAIKEKSIYKTYYFEFNDDVLFNYIIKDYSKSFQKIVRSCKHTISRILSENKCNNLRTCKFAFESFQEIINSLHKRFINDGYIKKSIFLSIFMYTVLSKNGNSIDDFSENYYDENTIVYPIKSLGKYVFCSVFDKEAIISEISVLDSERTILESKKAPESIKKLNDYWYTKTDKQLIEEIHDLYNNLETIPFEFYFRALYYFYSYKTWFASDESINIDDALNKMINQIEKVDKELDYNEDYLLFEKPKDLIPYFNELQGKFEKHNSFIRSKNLSVTSVSLMSYTIEDLKKIESDAYRYKCFFSKIDINQLVQTIVDGTSEDIILIRRFFHNVYRVSNIKTFFEDDYENLLAFYNLIKTLKFESIIKMKNMELLLKEVEGYLASLEPIE